MSAYEIFQRIYIGKVDFFEIQTDKAVYSKKLENPKLCFAIYMCWLIKILRLKKNHMECFISTTLLTDTVVQNEFDMRAKDMF